jgi:hypothetical protein
MSDTKVSAGLHVNAVVGSGRVRCLTLRTEMITTIADRIPLPEGIAVAANGVIFVTAMDDCTVRRISARKRTAAADSVAGRVVTTVIGDDETVSAQGFRYPMTRPHAICLVPSLGASAAASSAGAGAADEKDAVLAVAMEFIRSIWRAVTTNVSPSPVPGTASAGWWWTRTAVVCLH